MINTLWSIRTEALMLEEYLSTVTVSSLTGEVKDISIDEGVGLASDDKTDVVENERENSDGFHSMILSGFSSVIHVGCLGNSHERRPLLDIGLAPITPFGAGLAGFPGLTDCQSGEMRGFKPRIFRLSDRTDQIKSFDLFRTSFQCPLKKNLCF